MDIESGETYEEQIFSAVEMVAARVSATEFYDCQFVDCHFSETEFLNCQFHDCQFKNSDLSLVKLASSVFHSSSFHNCKLIGVDWTLLTYRKFIKDAPMQFKECDLTYGTFIGLTLQKLRATSCKLHEVDFSEADLTEADFSHTQLEGTRFRHTNLTQANLRRATGYDIDITNNTVTQAKFSMPEALSLLHRLDIEVE